jgi:hypothetical protein
MVMDSESLILFIVLVVIALALAFWMLRKAIREDAEQAKENGEKTNPALPILTPYKPPRCEKCGREIKDDEERMIARDGRQWHLYDCTG